MAYPELEPEADERLFLFLRIVKGCSLGVRLTDSGVVAHNKGALSGHVQSRTDESNLSSGGSS